MSCKYSNLDGVVEDLAVLTGDSQLNPSITYLGMDGEEYHSIFGRRRKKKRRKSGGLRSALGLTEQDKARRNARRDERVRSRSKERVMNAETQRKAVASASRPDKSEQQIAQALTQASTPPTPPPSTGLSTGAKIGIGVGILAVVGVLGFAIYKYTKRKANG